MTLTALAGDTVARRKVPLIVFALAAYVACALVLAPHTFPLVLENYIAQTIVLPPIIFVGLIVTAIAAQPRTPFSFIVTVVRRNTLRFLAILLGFCLALSAFTTIKLAIPHIIPFYADPLLADLDVALHFGVSPTDFVHWVLPQWAIYPMAWLYGPMWFLLWFGLAAFMAMHNDAELRTRYFWTLGLTLFVIGSLLALMLSSVGPVFYRDFYGEDRFAGLVAAIDASPVGTYMREATGYLLENFRLDGHALGTGISAMPSVHLAIVTLNAHMLTSINRVMGAFGWLYVVLILFESVYLGWHYAIDGYVSIAVVSFIWWGVGRLLQRARSQEAGQAEAA